MVKGLSKHNERVGEEKMKTVLLCHGDKGGVGKTILTTAFTDWANQRKIPLALIDADMRNADTIRMFKGEIPTKAVDLRRAEGWMDAVDFIMDQKDCNVVMSLAAGIGDRVIAEIPKIWGEIGRDRRLGMLWVMNRGPDSVNLLGECLKTLKPYLSFAVVVKNLYFGESSQFARWDESALKRNFEEEGGLTICLADLVDRVVDKLFNEADSVIPYSAAVVEPIDWLNSPKKLSASENVRLRQWITENRGEFERIAEAAGL